MLLPPLVLLCAGASSRAGAPKGLFVVEGELQIVRVLRAYAAAGGARAIVVLGFARDAYLARREWREIDGLRIDVATNAAPERGQFSSIQRGLALAEERAFVSPIDVPPVPAEVWRRLDRSIGDRDACVPTFGARGGHPVLLSARLIRELVAMSTEERLDVVLRARAAHVAVDDVENGGVITRNMNARMDFV